MYDFYLLRNLFFNVFFNGVKLHHLLKAIKNNSDLQEGVRVCFLKSVLQSHIGACGAFRLSCFKSNLQMLRVTRKNLIIRKVNRSELRIHRLKMVGYRPEVAPTFLAPQASSKDN